jgi:hypothetical protein
LPFVGIEPNSYQNRNSHDPSSQMNQDSISEQRLGRTEILLETAAAKIYSTSEVLDRLTERTDNNTEAIAFVENAIASNSRAGHCKGDRWFCNGLASNGSQL